MRVGLGLAGSGGLRKKQILGCAKDDRKKGKGKGRSKGEKQVLGCAKDDRKKGKGKSKNKRMPPVAGDPVRSG